MKLHDLIKTHIDLYYFIAKSKLEQASQEEQKHVEGIRQLSDIIKSDWKLALKDHLQQFTVPAVVFSALCVEALINYYGANRLEEKVFKNIEKKRTIEKFRLFPKLALQLQEKSAIDTKTEQAIRNLFKKRDSLVHYKTNNIKAKNLKTHHFITIPLAEGCLSTAKLACDFLCRTDPDFQFSFQQHVASSHFSEPFEVPTEKNMMEAIKRGNLS